MSGRAGTKKKGGTKKKSGGAGAGAGGAAERDTDVRVVIRARPLNDLEKSKAEESTCITCDGDSVDVKVAKADHAGTVRYSFDRVFGPETKQTEVYEFIGPDAITDVLNGYNSTIFAYGQTASGKTFTMLGPDAELSEYSKCGLIPRMVHGIFDGVDKADPNLEFSIKVSYVEIYMETIRDLLEPSSMNLQLREDKDRGVFIDKARSIYVSSPDEMMEVIAAGAENRELSATGMNSGSSRSHSVLIVTISQRNTELQSTKQGKLFLVDLAGSEMVSKTGAEGQQLEEAKMINRSLTALGKVIKSLTEGRGTHIPYRDSKLTRMLQESLGGNARTVLIICVSMSSFNQTETLSTVRFGNRAKHIKNKPRVNQTRSLREVETLLEASGKQNTRQLKVIAAMQTTINGYRALLKKHDIEDTVAPDDEALAAGVAPTLPDGVEAAAVAPVKSPVAATAASDSAAGSAGGAGSGGAAAGAGAGSGEAVDTNPRSADAAAPVGLTGSGESALRILELEDELAELKRTLEDQNSTLKEREDEVLCLSASLLEKEQLLFGAGIDSGESKKDETTGAAKVSRDALSRASHNLMAQEMEGLQKVYCQVCDQHPFTSAKGVPDLIVLHEQSCFEATENRELVKTLRQKNASLNAEVDALKGYIESGKVEDLMDGDGSSSKQRRREMRAEITKLQSTIEEKENEIERLQKVLVADMSSSKGGGSSAGMKKKAKLLEQELEIKTSALKDTEAQLATRTALVEDLENQLRTAGDASTVRELNHQLRQMVLVHRQLLRKFAVVDVECSETIMKLQARDQRIAELNRQLLKLNDEIREQGEWSNLQLQQQRLTHMKDIERLQRKAGIKEKRPADSSSKSSKGRVTRAVVRPVVRGSKSSGSSSRKKHAEEEERKSGGWGEV